MKAPRTDFERAMIRGIIDGLRVELAPEQRMRTPAAFATRERPRRRRGAR